MYIYFVFIFAFLVRLINLNQSLWLDETIVAKVVRTTPLLQIPFQFSIHDFHPPLYYMFMSLWTSFFGSSEIALRMPSILFSLVAGLYVYKIGSLLKDSKTAKWVAAFFLFNPLIIYYSQEARMYMMATAFLTACLFHFLNIIRTQHPQQKDIILFNIFSALAMLTFYGSVFFICGILIVMYFVFPKKYKLMLQMKIGFVISLLFLTPLLLQQLNNAKMGLEVVKNWSLVLGKAELKNFFMIFLKFATGRLSWYPKWSYYLFAGLPTLFIWILALLGMKKNKVLSFLFLFPLGVGLVVSFFTPMMMYFRFLYLIPVMSLLLGFGVIPVKTGIQENDKRKSLIVWIPAFAKMTTILIFLLFSFLYLLSPQYHREDWKKMVENINPTRPVYMILPSSDPLSYYDSALTPFELRNMEETALPEHIQVIPYVEELYGYNHEEILKKKECILESRSTYRGPLILENWKCPGEYVALKNK